MHLHFDTGMHKIPLLGEEFGDPGVELMRRLKTAWDPLNILNPGEGRHDDVMSPRWAGRPGR